MFSLSDIIKADLATIESDLGTPVATWLGEEYACIASSTGAKDTLELGGFSVDADVILDIRKELFTDAYPQSQQKITFNGNTYRIDLVRHDASGAFIRLYCVDTARGV